MILQLPVSADSMDYSFSIPLDGVIFSMRFTWNDRLYRWVMSIAEQDGTPIVNGISLNQGVLPLSQYVDDRLPKGDLFLWDTKSQFTEADYLNFGTSVLLMYAGVG